MEAKRTATKTLILVRNGSFDRRSRRLSRLGEAQMRALAPLLKPSLAPASTVLLASTAPQAQASAEILRVAFGLPQMTLHEALHADADHPRDDRAVLDIIRQQGCFETVVLVTHLPYVRDFPGFTGRTFCRYGSWPVLPDPKNGDARILSLADLTLRAISPAPRAADLPRFATLRGGSTELQPGDVLRHDVVRGDAVVERDGKPLRVLREDGSDGERFPAVKADGTPVTDTRVFAWRLAQASGLRVEVLEEAGPVRIILFRAAPDP